MSALLRLGTLAASLTGCSVFFDVTPPDAPDPPTPDAPPDVFVPDCYGHDLVQICLDTKPTTNIDLSPNFTTAVDTDDRTKCLDYNVVANTEDPGACVLAGISVRIDGTLRATGSRPLVIVSATSIDVIGMIDLSSQRDNNLVDIGAGEIDEMDGPDCFFEGADPAPNGAGGGGAGGSFGSLGGNGGNASDVADTKGLAKPALVPTRLHGGCRAGGGAGTTGSAGRGGGAIALLATTTITVAEGGAINTSGSAGKGGRSPLVGSGVGTGGGGGGAGGMIVLDGTLTNAGRIFANGGGGGEGGGNTSGNDGCDGLESIDPIIGTGGGPCASGGDGGDGGGIGALQGEIGGVGADDSSAGGGGGGGGVGVIRVFPAGQAVGRMSPGPS